MDKPRCDVCQAVLAERTSLKRHLLVLHERKLIRGSARSAPASADELKALWASETARREQEAQRRKRKSSTSVLPPADDVDLPPSTVASTAVREPSVEQDGSRVELQQATQAHVAEADVISGASTSTAVAEPTLVNRPATEGEGVCRSRAVYRSLPEVQTIAVSDVADVTGVETEEQLDRASTPTLDEPRDSLAPNSPTGPASSSRPGNDSMPMTTRHLVTSPVSDVNLQPSDSTMNLLYGILSGDNRQASGAVQMAADSLPSFVLANPEVLARAVLEQHSNPAALLSILSAARGQEVGDLARASSAMASGIRAFAEALAVRFFDDDDPMNTLIRIRPLIGNALQLPSSPEFYQGLVPITDGRADRVSATHVPDSS